ncbi:hypothetical protein [Prevotella falsenii]|uniref:hypothetical protein n=1 Tax=Prevotella falsenii TaxID=515414 RepID=UPI00046A00A7|nr:hypothetical protein [Prevotella falsenii]
MRHKHLFHAALLLMAAVLAGCANDDSTQNEGTQNNTATEAGIVTFASENPETRTTIEHSLGQGAKPYWSAGDKIWVKDTEGKFQQSGAGKFNSDMTHGVFTLSGTFSNGCTVHYTGANSTAGDKVTIANKQTQSQPNDFSHAGVSGDCGSATASGNGSSFKFRLDHKASYLCFLPRTSNEFVKRSTLYQIEIVSESPIAGTYDFSNGTLSNTPVSDASNTIMLTTGTMGFPITNSSTDITKNGAYVVIAPGNHTLTVRYWLHYKTATEDIKGTITKTFTLNCEAGKIYDITAKLDPTDYSYKKYYMWDCASGQDYWKGYESNQPKTKDAPAGSSYPKSESDPRWYNKQAFPAPAYRSCGGCPNVNETWWYIQYGDPHWDSEELWVMYEHLYTGGMWFKKKDYILTPNFNSNLAPDGKDYTTLAASAFYENNNAVIGRPDDIEKYFYLPALGSYNQGKFYNIGEDGNYWTCTPTPWNNSPGVATDGAYYLYFSLDHNGTKGTAKLYGGANRYKGFTWWEKK